MKSNKIIIKYHKMVGQIVINVAENFYKIEQKYIKTLVKNNKNDQFIIQINTEYFIKFI